MKNIIILLTVLTLIASAVPLTAKDLAVPSGANVKSMEDNLLYGLLTDNIGVQRSCALMLGKLQSESAVVPLMAIFANNSDENVRIAAAWALCNIGNQLGINAVKMAAKEDGSSKVQSICETYYENFKKGGKFSLPQPE
jgi:HEAT repeat protein